MAGSKGNPHRPHVKMPNFTAEIKTVWEFLASFFITQLFKLYLGLKLVHLAQPQLYKHTTSLDYVGVRRCKALLMLGIHCMHVHRTTCFFFNRHPC